MTQVLPDCAGAAAVFKRRPDNELYPSSVPLKPSTAAVAIALLSLHGVSVAGPTGGEVIAGAATINQAGAATTVINQTTPRAALNWQSFGIGAAESVIFQQPSSSAVALNRVVGPNPSAIYGTLQANGHVFLINPNGVLFARGANVDVAGLVASTLNMSNSDFMSGRLVFSGGAGAGAVVNQANIRTKDGGYVALLGNQVTNTGTIVANKGSVALGAGEAMVLDFNGDGLLSLKVNAAAAKAKIENTGQIIADGGAVIMSARAKGALLDTVLNVDGIVQARGLVEREGHIYLDGGRSGVTSVSGTLDASSATAKGGEVHVLGEYVGLFGNAKLDASGKTGGGTVLIGGDFQGKNPDVANALRTYVGPNALIKADAISNGDGGKVIVWADEATRFYGNISGKGGAEGGNGGFAEVSGKGRLDFAGRVDLRAPKGRAGTLLLDPIDLSVINGAAGDTKNVVGTPGVFESEVGDTTGSVLTDGSINAQLSAASVEVKTGIDTGANGDITFTSIAGSGDIVFDAGNNPNNLTFTARGSIFVNQATSYTNGSGTLKLASGTGSITIAQPLASTGDILLSAIGAATSDITVSSSLTKLGAVERTLTLQANRNIIFNSGTVLVDGGGSEKYNVVLNSGFSDSGGAVQLNAGTNINSNGGTITLGGGSVAGPAIGTATITTGISLSDAQLNSGGGAIKLNGKGFAGGNSRGIEISNGSQITAAGGTIEITGTGDAGTGDNYGVAIGSGTAPEITVTGTGSITIKGTGGTNGDDNYGVLLGGSTISAVNGPITIEGIAGSGTSQGIRIGGSADITSTGASLITLKGTGTGAAGIGGNIPGVGPNFAAGGAATIGGGAATGNIVLESLGGSDISLGSTGAVMNITTTGAGTISLTATGGGAISHTNGSISGDAAVTLTADKMNLASGINGGTVTLRPITAGTKIDLGSAVDTTLNTLELSSAELDQVTAGTLVIGRNDASAAGLITISDAIAPAGTSTLVLSTGGAITQTTGSIAVNDLALVAGGAVTMTGPGNNVANLASSSTSIDYVDADDLTIGSVASVNGITTTGGNVVVAAGGSLTINEAITTTPSSGNVDGGSVVLEAPGLITLDGLVSFGAITTTGSGSGAGGEVFIHHRAGSGSNDILLQGPIVAKGGATGAGGVVTVLNSDGNIFAEGEINVSRGATAVDPTKDGTIQLQAKGFIDGTAVLSGGVPGFFIGAANGSLLARTTNTTGEGYINLPGGCTCDTQNAMANIAFETRTTDDFGYVLYSGKSSVTIGTAGGLGTLTAPSGASAGSATIPAFSGIKTVVGAFLGNVTVSAVDVTGGVDPLPSITIDAPIVTTPPAGTGLAAGSVDIQADGNLTSTSLGTIDTRGADATAGPGGDGGEVFLYSIGSPATLSLGASINASGGAGSAGENGGRGAVVTLQNDSGSIVAHDIITLGGAAGSGAGGLPGAGGQIQLVTESATTGGTIGQQPNTRLEAASLFVVASDNVTLTNADNKVDTIAAVIFPGGNFSYTNADALTIDSLNENSSLAFTFVVTGFADGIKTNGGNVRVNTTSGALTVNESIDTQPVATGSALPGGSVVLESAGPLTVNPGFALGGIVTTGTDGGAGGEVFLRAAAGNITINEAITATGGFSPTSGVNGGPGGVVTIVAADGAIVLNGDIDVSGGLALGGGVGDVDGVGGTIQLSTAKINATSATITQGTGLLLAGGSVRGSLAIVSAADNVTLTGNPCGCDDNEIGTIAANIVAPGKSFNFIGLDALAIDTVARAGSLVAPSGAVAKPAADTVGIRTRGGAVQVSNIDTIGLGAALLVNQPIITTRDAGSSAPGGSVLLEADGPLTIAATGLIDTRGAANTTGAAGDGGEVFLLTNPFVSVSDITLDGPILAAGGSAALGGTTGGNGGVVTLLGTNLAINAYIDASGGATGSVAAGNGGTIQLTADDLFGGAGTITQTGATATTALLATGKVGGSLNVFSTGGVTLDNPLNNVAKVAAEAGTFFKYTNAVALAIDTVDTAGTLIGPLSGFVANDSIPFVGITAGGGVNGYVEVRTVSGGLNVNQPITTTPCNCVGDVGGYVLLKSPGDITIGNAVPNMIVTTGGVGAAGFAADTGFGFPATDGGPGGRAGDVFIYSTGGKVTMNGGIAAKGGRGGDGGAGDPGFASGGGGQGGDGGVVTIRTGNGAIVLHNIDTSPGAGGDPGAAGGAGSGSPGGPGARGDVQLRATGGTITQALSSALFGVNRLKVISNDAVTLMEPGNDVNVLAASISNASALNYSQPGALTIGAIPDGLSNLDSDNANLVAVTGVSTAGGAVTISAGSLSITDPISTQAAAASSVAGGAVSLIAVGSITSSAGATINTSGASGAAGAAGTNGTETVAPTDGSPGQPGGNAGTVSVQSTANGAITLDGNITAVGGAGGNGGAAGVPGPGGFGGPASAAVGGVGGAGASVTVNGGSGTVSVASVTTSGGAGGGGKGAAGGAAGATALTSSTSITLTGAYAASGGDAQGPLTNNGGAAAAITMTGPAIAAGTVDFTTIGGAAGGAGSQPGASGDVTFTSTLEGQTAYADKVTIAAGSGNVIFGGLIGDPAAGLKPLGGLTIGSAFNVAGSADGATPAPAMTLGTLTQTSGSGRTHLSTVTTKGVANGDGGAVNISTSGNLTVTGAIDTSGGATTSGNPGGKGGDVSLTAKLLSIGAITTSGSNATDSLEGGAAGSIAINDVTGSSAVSLNGNLTARGGNGAVGAVPGDGGNGGLITIGRKAVLGADVTIDTTGGTADSSRSPGTDGNVTFAAAVDSASAIPASAKSLEVKTSQTTTFGGAVGSVAPLASLTINAGGTTNLNGGVVTTTGAQTYNDAVVLGADTTLASTAAGNITFNSTIESTNAGPPQFGLAVNTTGTTTFAGNVGPAGTLAPTFLTIGSGGTTVFAGIGGLRTIRTDGPQTYNSAVRLDIDTLLQTCGCTPATIAFGSTINADVAANARKLGASANGNVSFAGNIGVGQALAELSVSTNAVAGAAIVFNGASAQTVNVTAGGTGILMAGPVTLAQNVTMDSGASSTIFNSTIDGGFALSTTSSQLTRFSGAIGTTALASLDASGPIDLNAGTVKTSAAQTYGGTVNLGPAGNATTLTSTATGNVTFNGTVDGNGINAQALTISTGGTSTFNNFVGSINRLESLTLSGGGAVVINTPAAPGLTIGTNAGQSYSGPVTIAGENAFLVSDGGTPGPISFTSTIDSGVAGPRALTVSTSGQITFGDKVGSIRALDALTTTGGAVAVNVPATSGSAIITNNAQSYDQTVMLGGAAGPIEFRGGSLSFNGSADALLAGARPLTLTTDALTLGGNVSGTGTLLIQPTADNLPMGIAGGAGTLTLPTGTLDLLQDGFTSITLGRAASTAATTVSAVTFRDPVTIRGLSIFVDGPITGTGNASVALTPTPSGGGGIELASNIRTSGQPIALNGPVTLTANSVLVDPTCASGAGCAASPGGADVTFALTIRADNSSSQNRALTVTAGSGTAIFGGNIGAGTNAALADLDVTAGTIRLNAGTINVNDGNAPAATATFNGDVVLGANVTVNTNRASGTDTSVSFGGAIDGDNTTTGRALAIDAGGATVTFNNVIGGTGSLSDFDVTAGSIVFNTTNLNVIAPNAATAPTVTLNGTASLPLGLTISTNGHGGGAGSVTLGQVSGPGGLNVNAPADVVSFNGPVGVSTPLLDLNVSASRINLNAATFNLDGGDSTRTNVFSGPVFLGAAVVTIDADRTGTSDSGVTFSSTSTVNADNAANDRVLNVTGGNGTVTFSGNVGGTAAISGLTVTAGAINLNAATFNVDGGASGGVTTSFTGPVRLGAPVVSIDADRASGTDNVVRFEQTVDSSAGTPRALDINAGSGSVTFAGNVGGLAALTNLTVTGGSINLNAPTFNLNGGTVAQNAAFNGPVTLGANVTVNTDRTGANDSNVTFGSSIGSDAIGTPRSLAVGAGLGTATFSGNIGSGTGLQPLSDFDVTAPTIVFNSTAGAQPVVISSGGSTTVGLNGNVTVATNSLQLSTGGANIAFNGTVAGDTTVGANRSLSANAGTGTVTFGGEIGSFGGGELSSVAVTGSTINLNGVNVMVNRNGATPFTSSFNGPVVLGAPGNVQVTMIADKQSGTDNSLSFGSSISGASHPLVLQAGTGSITVTVTGATSVASLAASAQTAVNLGPVTTTGAVTLDSDSMALNGISAAGQTVTLRDVSDGRTILLGGDSPSSLALNVTELAGITANTLLIGRKVAGPSSGAISIASNVSPKVSTLHLFTGAGITGTGSGVVLPTAALAIEARAAVSMNSNNVATLAANTAVGGITFGNAAALAIGAVDGVTGVTTTVSGAIDVTSAGNLALGSAVNAASGAGNVTLTSTGGNITGSGPVTGNAVALDSATGVGTSTGARVNTNARSLAARSRLAGGVFVNETNLVTLSTIGAVTNNTAGSQGYDLVAGGAITVDGPVSTANVDTSGVPGTNATSGGITLLANGGITGGSGTLTTGTATASGAATASSGSISATATGGALRTDQMTTGAANASGTGTAIAGDITLGAGQIGSSGISQSVAFGTASGGATNTQGVLDASTTGTSTGGNPELGQMLVVGTTELRVRNLTTVANAQQNLKFEAQNGDLTFLAGGVDTGIAGSGNAFDGDVVNAVSTGAGNNIVFARAMTPGSMSANSAGAVNVNANLATSPVSVTGGGASVSSGGVSITGQSSVTGAGTITTGALAVNGSAANATAQSGGITVTSTSGDIGLGLLRTGSATATNRGPGSSIASGAITLQGRGIGTAVAPQAVATAGLLNVTSQGADALGDIFITSAAPLTFAAATVRGSRQTVNVSTSGGALTWAGQASGLSGTNTAFNGDDALFTATGAGGNILVSSALVAGSVTLNSSGGVDVGPASSGVFLNQVDLSGAAPGTSASTGNITIDAAGAVTGSGDVLVSPVTSNGGTATGGSVTINAQRIGTAGAPLKITIHGVDGGTTNVQGRLTASAADGIFVTSPVRFTTGALTTTANGAPIDIGTTNDESMTLAGNISTNNGAVSLGAPRTLLGSDVVVTANGGAVTFAGGVESPLVPRSLQVTTTGQTTFGGAVGHVLERLSSLSIDGGGATRLNGDVSTTGAQIYAGNVALGANSVLTGGVPTFNGGVTGGGFDLRLNFSGPTSIDGATFTGIHNLRTDNGGVTNLTGALTTTGTQTYIDSVTLTGNTTLTGTTPIFIGTVTGGGFDLALNFSGTTTVSGGTFTGIRNLSTGNGGLTTLTGTLATTGTQTYNDNVTLDATTTLDAGAGNIVFSGTVNGAFRLTTNGTGTTTFGGAVGGATPLASLTVNAAGTAINGGTLTTSGNQFYSSPVTIGADTTMTSTAANITFAASANADAVANNRGLTINAPLGTVTFSGNLGDKQPFADLDVIAGPDTIVFNAPTPQTVNVMGPGGNTVSFTGNVRLNQNLTLNTGGGTGNSVVFNNGIEADSATANRTLAVNAGGGNVTFGAVGNAAPLAMLNVNGSTIVFNAKAVGQQIVVGANQALVDSTNGLIQALAPFTGYDGPAALTFTGPASGGIFGSQASMLRVDVPGLLVVTPNESRALPTVWLQGDPAKKPSYQWYDDPTHRQVVFNAPPVNPSIITDDPSREILKSEKEELATPKDAQSVVTAGVQNTAREPDVCTSTEAKDDGALACGDAKPER